MSKHGACQLYDIERLSGLRRLCHDDDPESGAALRCAGSSDLRQHSTRLGPRYHDAFAPKHDARISWLFLSSARIVIVSERLPMLAATIAMG
jgi:hypothetical protein